MADMGCPLKGTPLCIMISRVSFALCALLSSSCGGLGPLAPCGGDFSPNIFFVIRILGGIVFLKILKLFLE